MSTDSWAVGNRILCDFFHRGIAPPRLPAADRIVLGLPETLAVGDVMTRSVLRVRAATSIRDAARLMYERKLGALPVVEGERLIGLLTETDVLRAFQELLGPTTAPAVTP